MNDRGFTSEIGATYVLLLRLRTSRGLDALVQVLLANVFVVRSRQVSKASNFWWNRAFSQRSWITITTTVTPRRLVFLECRTMTNNMKLRRVLRLFVAPAVIASRHITIKNTAHMGSTSMSSIRSAGRNMPPEEPLATPKCQGQVPEDLLATPK